MKLFLTLLPFFFSLFLAAQDTDPAKHKALEFFIGYERTGLYNYQQKSAGGFNDADFEALSKSGNKIPIGLRISLRLKDKNELLIGLRANIHQVGSKLISGWTGKVLASNNNVFISPGIEVGHRYYLFSKANIEFAVENKLLFEYLHPYDQFNFRKSSLLWQPSLRLEKKTQGNLSFFYTLNYGVGLFSARPHYSGTVISNTIGMAIGVRAPF